MLICLIRSSWPFSARWQKIRYAFRLEVDLSTISPSSFYYFLPSLTAFSSHHNFSFQREQLQAFLNAFREHPAAWTRVDTILEKSARYILSLQPFCKVFLTFFFLCFQSKNKISGTANIRIVYSISMEKLTSGAKRRNQTVYCEPDREVFLR